MKNHRNRAKLNLMKNFVCILFTISSQAAFSQNTLSIIGSWLMDSSSIQNNSSFPKNEVAKISLKGQRWTFMNDSTFTITSKDAAINSGTFTMMDLPVSTLLHKNDSTKKMDTVAKMPAKRMLTMMNKTLGIKLTYAIVSLSNESLVLQSSEEIGTKTYYLGRR
jgi:hypothetical protein